jgi:hypothetical protein
MNTFSRIQRAADGNSTHDAHDFFQLDLFRISQRVEIKKNT